MNKKVLAIVFFTVFMDLVGFGIIIPIQTAYALSFGATATVVTLLSASFSAMQFLFAPFCGVSAAACCLCLFFVLTRLSCVVPLLLFSWFSWNMFAVFVEGLGRTAR